MEKIISRIEHGEGLASDPDLLLNICDNIQGNTICPLGDAAAMPIRSFVQKFGDEFRYHIDNRKCMV
jgi:NADH-quinone oxidoreductase subunit F